MPRLKPITLEELRAKQQADPAWVATEAARERAIAEEAAVYREIERPIVLALAEAGVPVSTVWDLINTDERYPQAVSILLNHLELPYREDLREGIARALAVPDAAWGWHRLERQFAREPVRTKRDVKYALALALGAAGDDTVLDDVIRLLEDRTLERLRVPLIQVLLRSREARAKEALKALTNDPTIGKDAASASKKGKRWIRKFG